MNTSIDWKYIGEKIGVKNDGPVGSDDAKKALDLIIGPDNLRAAVDHYVYQKEQSELVRNVLWYLHSEVAMNRCYELYRNNDDLEVRRSAVELLRVVSDQRGVKWVQEFLEDPDEGIQNLGVSMLDQLIWGGGLDHDDPDAKRLLLICHNHTNNHVREQYEFIQSYLKRREINS